MITMQRDTFLAVENMFSIIFFIQPKSVQSCGKPVRFQLVIFIPLYNFLSLSVGWIL